MGMTAFSKLTLNMEGILKAILSTLQKQENFDFEDSTHHQCLLERELMKAWAGSSEWAVKTRWCITGVPWALTKNNTKISDGAHIGECRVQGGLALSWQKSIAFLQVYIQSDWNNWNTATKVVPNKSILWVFFYRFSGARAASTWQTFTLGCQCGPALLTAASPGCRDWLCASLSWWPTCVSLLCGSSRLFQR